MATRVPSTFSQASLLSTRRQNLQIIVSGTGEMRANGQPETVNLLQRLEELGPLAKALLLALNAALIAWFIQLLSKKGARDNAHMI